MSRSRFAFGMVVLGISFTLSAWTAQAETLTGRVYVGDVGVEPPQSSALQGAQLRLYAANNPGQLGSQIDSATSDSSGGYGLNAQTGYEYYTIVCEGKSGYVFQGATSVGGTVSNNTILYSTASAPMSQQTLTGNKFWYKSETPVNHPPVANAGPDQAVNAGSSVHLDGSASSDADGDPLTYSWSLISVPAGSSAALDNPTAVQPRFTADLAGTYIAQLVVNDGKVDSAPDTVSVSATSQPPRTGTITGYKFNDENGDGIWNGIEPGLAGWTIFADMNPWNAQLDPGEPSDVTGPDGSYSLSGLVPGVYNVYEVAQPGWQVTYPGSGFHGFTILANDLYDHRDFGNHQEGMPPEGQVDTFDVCLNLEITFQDGSVHRLSLSGPATESIHIGPNGQATDTNGNGRDDASTELTDLQLIGLDPVVGQVRIGLNAALPSVGQIEERVNNTPGIIDVPPYVPAGSADSFFDVFFEIQFPDIGVTLHTTQAKQLAGVIDHLPPGSNVYSEISPKTIDLVDENGQPTGFRLGPLTSCQTGYRRDYGDAPAPYPDASHVPGQVWLGFTAPDTEVGTQTNPPGQGDDTHGIDDEDGAWFMSDLVPGQFTWLALALSGLNQDLTYAVWIDYNGNGIWEHPGELYSSGSAVKLAASPLGLVIANPIPAGAQIGTTFMRVRVYPGKDVPVSPSGDAQGGEVEDYQVQIKRTGQVQPPGHGITGIKFNDLDGDGMWEPLDGEQRLPNWVIWLDTNQDGQPDQTTTTDPNGGFEFAPVQPGTYTIGEQEQLGWTQTSPAGTGTFTTTVPNTALPTLTFMMFGNTRGGGPGSVTLVKKAVPADDTLFDFAVHQPGGFFDVLVISLSDPSGSTWSIGDLEHLQKVVELVPVGWILQDITVTGDTDHGSSIDLASATVQVDYDEGEDIVIVFTNARTGPAGEYDFGDAPDTYGTLHSSGGPYHDIGEVRMGSLVDPEPDGQPGPQADRDDNTTVDDEDGVALMIPMSVGGIASVRVDIMAPIGVPAAVAGWVDFDHSGTFEEPGERIASGIYTGAGVPVPWTETFQVPILALGGETCMRFRIFRTEPGVDVLPSPTGYGGEGEVEDYKIYILSGGPGPDDELDYGDAPNPYPAASHSLGGPRLGDQPPDAEAGTQSNPPGLGDDVTGTDDEDGAQFLTDLVLGQPFAVSWKAHTSNLALLAVGWIDFNRDGDWDDPGEFLGGIGCQGCTWVMMTISKPVPAGVTPGKTYARFRAFSGMGAGTLIAPSGHGGPGEVEDYEVEIKLEGVVLPPGEIVGGVKFNDLNGNGTFDSGELGLANWTVWIDLNGNGVKDAGEATLTNPDGTFYFMALNPGTYIVHEDMQPGWTQTCPGGAGTRTITVQAGQPTPSILFGNRLMGDEELDFGDALDSYKTLKTSGGPCHKAGPLTLGRRVDIESTGVPSADALGDDNAGIIDDEDGIANLAELNLIAGQPAVIHVTVANNDIVQNNGTVVGWIDFDGDGQFNAAAECIGCQFLFMGAGGTFVLPFPFAVPANAKTGTTYVRFRLFRKDMPTPPGVVEGFTPTGVAGSTGEVEDYMATIQGGVSPDDRDYGDAPHDGITTFYPSANHQVGGPWWGDLSDLPDVEPGMQRNNTATGDDTDALGDDENGLFGANLVQGQNGGLYVSFVPGGSGDVTLHGWVDFNHDGDWDDAGEASGPWPLALGPIPTGGWPNPIHVILPFAVPAQAQVGQTFARLRIEEGLLGFISHTGPAGAGEVEDHLVEIKASGPPVPSTGMIWGIKFQDLNGNRIWEVGTEPVLPNWTIWLDSNHNGAYDGADATAQTDGWGLFAFTGLTPGTYLVGEEQQPGWIQTWPAAPGGTHTVTVQANTLPWGILFGNMSFGGTLLEFDWGDAPDPTYPTLRANNGAYHPIKAGFHLGQRVDSELDGQPSPDAMADDFIGLDDEDGVAFLTPILPGQMAGLEIIASAPGFVDAWIDLDTDGTWNQAPDQILKAEPVTAGSNVMSVAVPGTAAVNVTTYARFRFSSAGHLPFDGPAQDGEVEDYHVLLGEDGPYVPGEGDLPHLKWSQPPIEIDPNLDPNSGPPVFCGWDEPAQSTQRSGAPRQWQMVADDFRCLGPVPITRIRWWGSYLAWDRPEPPVVRPAAWHIGFWANRVEGLGFDQVYPERLVWSLEIPADRVHLAQAGVDLFPQRPSETCFVYELPLEPNEWFWQAEFPAQGQVFWISITAVYPPDAEQVYLWGWKTRPRPWRKGGQLLAIEADWPTPDLQPLIPGRIQPVTDSLICEKEEMYDLAFELLTERPWIKWDQPWPDLRRWPYAADRPSMGIEDEKGRIQVLNRAADDWICRSPDEPVIALAWYGSYIGYGYEACKCRQAPNPRRLDSFLISMWTAVPADGKSTDSHPGELIWEYKAQVFDEVLVGYDSAPTGEPNEPVFRYAVRLPEEKWFRQEKTDQVYWLSVVAVYKDPVDRMAYTWGWTDRPQDAGGVARATESNSGAEPRWRILRDPLDRGVDLCFTLYTRPPEP